MHKYMYTCIHKHIRTKNSTHLCHSYAFINPYRRAYVQIYALTPAHAHTHTSQHYSMLLANTFFGLHELARQMETLFGEEKQCLPLDAISRFILFYILWSNFGSLCLCLPLLWLWLRTGFGGMVDTAKRTWDDIFGCCFKAQSLKLERLFFYVSDKRDVRAFSLQLWKMSPQMGLAVQHHFVCLFVCFVIVFPPQLLVFGFWFVMPTHS